MTILHEASELGPACGPAAMEIFGGGAMSADGSTNRSNSSPPMWLTTNVVGTCVLLEVDRIEAAGLTDLDVGQGRVCRNGGAYKIAWDFETLEQAGTKLWLFRSPSIKD
jgi:hypothetical protein